MRRVSPRQGQSQGQGREGETARRRRDWRIYADLAALERSELAILVEHGYADEHEAGDAMKPVARSKRDTDRHLQKHARPFAALLTLGHIRLARAALTHGDPETAAYHTLRAGLHASGGAMAVKADSARSAHARARKASAAKRAPAHAEWQAMADRVLNRKLKRATIAQRIHAKLEDRGDTGIPTAEWIAKVITYP